MLITEIIGWVGFSILVCAWIPQTWETVKKGYNTANLAFNVMYVIASILLTIYSVLIVDNVFIMLNGLITIGSAINLYYKIFPRTIPDP